jgi:hypothetical protein
VTADPPIPMVWLGAAGPDAAQSRALSGWAQARGLELVLPSSETPRAIAVDPHAATAMVDDVERLLDRVGDAVAGRDGEAADEALAAAESSLRAHPELAQASWLMAEVERARSSRFGHVQPLDEEAAERAWLRAEALDGGRVPGMGERPTTAHPADATLVLDPLLPPVKLRLDGRDLSVGAGVFVTRAGLHALVGTWNDMPVWAGWIEVPPGRSALELTVPVAPPCSLRDVASVRLTGGDDGDGGAVDAASVRCASWVAALPGPRPSSVLVTPCQADRCGSLVEWRAPGPARAGGWEWTPAAEPSHARWPSWATWGLVGAGAVLTTGVVVVASAVLRGAPSEMRFVSGGVKAQ